jgi:hypothetical protein
LPHKKTWEGFSTNWILPIFNSTINSTIDLLLSTMKLYRAISIAEMNDFKQNDNSFRTAKNTLEAKQFFKSETAVETFVRESVKQNYRPAYKHILIVDINEQCLNEIRSEEQMLDGFEALTVAEEELPVFNNCINFTEDYDA